MSKTIILLAIVALSVTVDAATRDPNSENFIDKNILFPTGDAAQKAVVNTGKAVGKTAASAGKTAASAAKTFGKKFKGMIGRSVGSICAKYGLPEDLTCIEVGFPGNGLPAQFPKFPPGLYVLERGDPCYPSPFGLSPYPYKGYSQKGQIYSGRDPKDYGMTNSAPGK